MWHALRCPPPCLIISVFVQVFPQGAFENNSGGTNLRSKLGPEMVNLGSTRLGLERDGNENGHEENAWTLQPDKVWLPGFLLESDLDTLSDMAKKKAEPSASSIIIPGVSMVFLSFPKALEVIRNLPPTANEVKKVVYEITIDNKKGFPNYLDLKKGWNLKTCFNLFKLT